MKNFGASLVYERHVKTRKRSGRTFVFFVSFVDQRSAFRSSVCFTSRVHNEVGARAVGKCARGGEVRKFRQDSAEKTANLSHMSRKSGGAGREPPRILHRPFPLRYAN